MIHKIWFENTPFEVRRVCLYDFLYTLFFVLSYLMVVSTFTFFHFLLNHDMGTVENWLNRNTWEILSLSKIVSLIIVLNIVKINLYKELRISSYFMLGGGLWIPSRKIIVMTIFILTIFYAFITQFGGGIVESEFQEYLFYSSFIGSFLFYFADFFVLYVLIDTFDVKRANENIVMYISFVFFLISAKIALPYLNKFYIFLLIHFMTLFQLGRKKKLIDPLFYALFVIAPLTALYGLDIVWDNAYSVFSYRKSLPIIGVVGIWAIAVGYYHFPRSIDFIKED